VRIAAGLKARRIRSEFSCFGLSALAPMVTDTLGVAQGWYAIAPLALQESACFKELASVQQGAAKSETPIRWLSG